MEYKQFRDDLRSKYKDEVKKAENEFDDQFKDYEWQHSEYIKHTGKITLTQKILYCLGGLSGQNLVEIWPKIS